MLLCPPGKYTFSLTITKSATFMFIPQKICLDNPLYIVMNVAPPLYPALLYVHLVSKFLVLSSYLQHSNVHKYSCVSYQLYAACWTSNNVVLAGGSQKHLCVLVNAKSDEVHVHVYFSNHWIILGPMSSTLTGLLMQSRFDSTNKAVSRSVCALVSRLGKP